MAAPKHHQALSRVGTAVTVQDSRMGSSRDNAGPSFKHGTSGNLGFNLQLFLAGGAHLAQGFGAGEAEGWVHC